MPTGPLHADFHCDDARVAALLDEVLDALPTGAAVAVAAARVRVALADAVPHPDPRQVAAGWCGAAGGRIEIRLSDAVLRKLSDGDVRAVLAHELAHAALRSIAPRLAHAEALVDAVAASWGHDLPGLRARLDELRPPPPARPGEWPW